MFAVTRKSHHLWLTLVAMLLGLSGTVSPVLAAGGNVLPATAKPHGYSLQEAARTTAVFNIPPRIPNELPNDFPFQVLYVTDDSSSTTITVARGTMLYVPVIYSTGDVVDLTDPEAFADLYFSPDLYGAEFVEIVVDGKVTSLGRSYVAGAVVPGLDAGLNPYSAIAAFLTPLPKGTHTVAIRGRFSGALLGGEAFEFAATYTVIVR